MYCCHMYLEDHAQDELSNSGVCSWEMADMLLVSHVCGLVKNFNNVINAKLCMMVLCVSWHDSTVVYACV